MTGPLKLETEVLFEDAVDRYVVLPDYGSQVFVFQFPSVIHRVIRGVAHQVPMRPRSRRFPVSMEGASRGAVCLEVRLQMDVVGHHHTWRRVHPDLLRPPLFNAKGMGDDSLPITPSAALTLSHLRGHAPTHIVEERPTCLLQSQLTF